LYICKKAMVRTIAVKTHFLHPIRACPSSRGTSVA
jgi:hypothetical protein